MRRIHFGTKQRYILEIGRKRELLIFLRNKKIHSGNWNETRIMLFGTKQEVKNEFIFVNWNKIRRNSFLEMGKSSSNVPNVFKGLSLTGHC